jgi:uncharacterized protein
MIDEKTKLHSTGLNQYGMEMRRSRMEKAIELQVDGLTLRGMEHVPSAASENPVPAVILYHGFTGTKCEAHQLFVKISRALEKNGIAAFRFDFAGSGDSDGNFEHMTASSELRDAAAILSSVRSDPRVQADQVTLLGLSMGGFVAGITAGDHPEAVHRLVLLAPAGNLPQIMQGRAVAAGVGADSKYFDHNGNLVGVDLYRDLQHIDGFDRAKPYQGPVLLMHGTEDQAVPYQVSEKYVAGVYGDRATLRLIDGAGHTFDSFAWEMEVIETIVSFLKS